MRMIFSFLFDNVLFDNVLMDVLPF